MSKSDFGLIGLAVMGQNLVLNVESRGFRVSVYNRTTETMEKFIAENPGKNLHGAATLEDFVAGIERPRRIMMLVQSKAGFDPADRDAVDGVIEQLTPLLEPGDLIIDGGNTYFIHTERRSKAAAERGLLYIGTGVSGGEEGARKGPAIMPGGPKESWELVKPIFEAIAAKVDDVPCVTHIGAGGAGHFVKMVHNGIEYGDMQLICEAYQLFKTAGLSTAEMGEIFDEWNQGDLESYLIQITSKIFTIDDSETGQPTVEMILDTAGQKGTGRWTQMISADNAVVVSTINAAVEARILSSMLDQRRVGAREFDGPEARIDLPKAELVKKVRDALYASKIISYAQGLDLIKRVGEAHDWGLDLAGIARIWRGGCIIRARFLNRITEAYERNPELVNLMLDPFFKDILNANQANWREIVALGVTNGIPVPAFSASLGYYDSYRAERLPANLLQAQRDFFGAHTYERTDKPRGEFFHTEWPEVIG
ncbi:MAG: decarboxylating NADP(+)-dependent phosphogluconate dehydrogenase [Akkermansiaceae bacterium]|nr:decarboxylating NADP(+)-dependent phosphogluconate dehydrogenase [Akkermansiaceae bacterium]MCP5551376.1 decarboxylating NADP(+)-dependent phosphogluconate dehydrogenase [Akkermansiaceae bacterium]